MPDGVITCFGSCAAAGSMERTGFAPRHGFGPLLTFANGVAGRWLKGDALWVNGVRNFTAGDLVYEVTPNGAEVDYAIDPYVCTANVVSAGAPSADAAHFRSFWDNSYEQHHIYAGLSYARPLESTVVPGGYVVPVFQRGRWEFFQAREAAPANEYNQVERFEKLAMTRALFEARAWQINQCAEVWQHKRYRTMRQMTRIVDGDESETVYGMGADGAVSVALGLPIVWGVGDDVWYGRKGGNYPYFWQGRQLAGRTDSWEPSIVESRLHTMEFEATRMRFVWHVTAETRYPKEYPPTVAAETVETDVEQVVTLENEFTLEANWAALVMGDWPANFGAVGGGSTLKFDAVHAVTVPVSPFGTPQVDPRLVARESRHRLLGPTYCERTSFCSGAASRCETKPAGTGCEGGSVEYLVTLGDLGKTVTVQDRCACAP